MIELLYIETSACLECMAHDTQTDKWQQRSKGSPAVNGTEDIGVKGQLVSVKAQLPAYLAQI